MGAGTQPAICTGTFMKKNYYSIISNSSELKNKWIYDEKEKCYKIDISIIDGIKNDSYGDEIKLELSSNKYKLAIMNSYYYKRSPELTTIGLINVSDGKLYPGMYDIDDEYLYVSFTDKFWDKYSNNPNEYPFELIFYTSDVIKFTGEEIPSQYTEVKVMYKLMIDYSILVYSGINYYNSFSGNSGSGSEFTIIDNNNGLTIYSPGPIKVNVITYNGVKI